MRSWLLLILISRLPLAWSRFRLSLRGEPNGRPRFVYLCRAPGCQWVSDLMLADDRHIRCSQHAGAGTRKVFVNEYSCPGCGQILVYPREFDPDLSQHVQPGVHAPPPLRTD